jgi:cell division protein ZapA (FtsZ GTPase activity inhibitor)
MPSTTTPVEIFGEVYHVRGDDENGYLQSLADLYSVAVRSFRAKQAAAESTEQTNQEAAAVNAAEQDAAGKARHEATDQKADEGTEKPVVPKGN